MTTTTPFRGPAEDVPIVDALQRQPLLHRRRRKRHGGIAVRLAATWASFIVVLSLTVQWLPIANYTAPVGTPNAEPSWSKEFLGLDGVGRSLVSRLAYGARVSVAISFSATLLAMLIGGTLGLLSVYFPGWITGIIDTFAAVILSIPPLLFLLAIMLALRPSLPVLIGSLALTQLPAFMRLTRSSALNHVNREYVIAARLMACGGFRLMFREVLPNSIAPVISYATLVLPVMMIAEGSLSFLGFGVQPPTPSWGAAIAQAQPALTTSPWPAVIPCIVLFLTIFSLNTLADNIRLRLDVREAQI